MPRPVAGSPWCGARAVPVRLPLPGSGHGRGRSPRARRRARRHRGPEPHDGKTGLEGKKTAGDKQPRTGRRCGKTSYEVGQFNSQPFRTSMTTSTRRPPRSACKAGARSPRGSGSRRSSSAAFTAPARSRVSASIHSTASKPAATVTATDVFQLPPRRTPRSRPRSRGTAGSARCPHLGRRAASPGGSSADDMAPRCSDLRSTSSGIGELSRRGMRWRCWRGCGS